MNYIKLFENFKKNNYYTEIHLSDIEKFNFEEHTNSEKFKELEAKLNEKNKEKGIDFEVEETTIFRWLLDMGYDEFDEDDLNDKDLLCYKFVITTHESSYVADQNNVENIFIDIIEIEDEYYFVDIQEEHLIAHGGGKYSTNYITKNYKCDQWDGLEKLLKDKGLL